MKRPEWFTEDVEATITAIVQLMNICMGCVALMLGAILVSLPN